MGGVERVVCGSSIHQRHVCSSLSCNECGPVCGVALWPASMCFATKYLSFPFFFSIRVYFGSSPYVCSIVYLEYGIYVSTKLSKKFERHFCLHSSNGNSDFTISRHSCLV